MKEDLKAPFPTNIIKWRIGSQTKDKTKCMPLAYIDARAVMKRLDDVCGIENWQCRYPFEGCCELGIKFGDEWIWKTNGAGTTKIEGEKGQYSDAFKRAAVVWGIGRYLYYLPNQWVALVDGKFQNPTLPKWATVSKTENKKAVQVMNTALANYESIKAIKNYIAENNIEAAAEAFAEIPQEVRMNLNLASTKGGPFSVEENKVMLSDEFKEFMFMYKKKD